MTKKDKLIIEIEYDHSPCHYSDEEMEEIVNNWSKKILKELQDPRSVLYPHFMAMAMINAKNIVRQSNVIKNEKTKQNEETNLISNGSRSGCLLRISLRTL